MMRVKRVTLNDLEATYCCMTEVPRGVSWACMQDVCTQEEHMVMSMEDYVAAQGRLPAEKIPKPESWTK